MALPGRYRILNHTTLAEASQNAYFADNMLAYIDGVLHIKEAGVIKPAQTVLGEHPFTDIATSESVLYVDIVNNSFYRWNGTAYVALLVSTSSDAVVNESNVAGASVTEALNTIESEINAVVNFNISAINYTRDTQEYVQLLEDSGDIYWSPVMEFSPLISGQDSSTLEVTRGSVQDPKTILNYRPSYGGGETIFMATFMLNGIDGISSSQEVEVGLLVWNTEADYNSGILIDILTKKTLGYSNKDVNTTSVLFTEQTGILNPNYSVVPYFKFPGGGNYLEYDNCSFTVHRVF